jgi:hypothetical protein
VDADVAVVGRYRGLPLAGPAIEFDYLLRFWLSRALEMGMIGSGLGELFPIPLEKIRTKRNLRFGEILLVGMGEPGSFGADDLRFLMANVTVPVKSRRKLSFSTSLIGAGRNELSIEGAARGFLDGVLDGYYRCQSILEAMVESEREQFERAFFGEVRILLVEKEEARAKRTREEFERLQTHARVRDRVCLHVGASITSAGMLKTDSLDSSADTPTTDERLTFLRVNCPRPTEALGVVLPAEPRTDEPMVFQYSALTQMASVSVRELNADPYFVQKLPEKIMGSKTAAQREDFGRLWANYLIPEDLHQVIGGSDHLTLVLDGTTACYPWEMVALPGHRTARFLGIEFQLTRLFRTLFPRVPGIPPPLNNELRVLIIANPCPHFSDCSAGRFRRHPRGPLLPPSIGHRSGGWQDPAIQDRSASHARQRSGAGAGGHHGHGRDLGRLSAIRSRQHQTVNVPQCSAGKASGGGRGLSQNPAAAVAESP